MVPDRRAGGVLVLVYGVQLIGEHTLIAKKFAMRCVLWKPGSRLRARAIGLDADERGLLLLGRWHERALLTHSACHAARREQRYPAFGSDVKRRRKCVPSGCEAVDETLRACSALRSASASTSQPPGLLCEQHCSRRRRGLVAAREPDRATECCLEARAAAGRLPRRLSPLAQSASALIAPGGFVADSSRPE
jgi:hypothetical protein